MKILHAFTLGLFIIILLSCGATQPYYADKNISRDALQADMIPVDMIDYEVYLVGDIGANNTNVNESSITDVIKSQLRPDSKFQSVIFLGNSIGKEGLPERKTPDYDMVDAAMEHCIKQLKDNTDKVYFIPGSNEWYDGEGYTTEAVGEVEKYFQSKVSKKNIFAPSKGCGEPKVVELTDDLIIILVDSQWILQGDATDERTRSSCDIDTQVELVTALREILSDYKNKNVIVATHHPVFTNGKTGGNYAPINHLLPLPVVGSIITGIRKIGGGPQQFGHPKYEAYRTAMNLALANFEGVIVASAHDHNMQYIPKNNNHFVVAGSGSDVDFALKGGYADFAAMEEGYAKIIHTKDLELYIEFYKVNPTIDAQPILLYRKLLYKKEVIDYQDESIYKDADDYPDSKTVVASQNYSEGRFGMGKTYRTEWGTEVEAPLLILDEVGGGVVPVQQGGGFQTKSLRLENADGQQWVVRTIDKDVTKVVPIEFRSTVVQDLVQDGISAAHPYGAFVIPKLAEAAKIYHANPRYVWLPKQKALGDYNKDFAERLYLFEERPGGNMENHPSYGGAKKSINTVELVEKLTDNHQAKVDQEYVLRARLLDILIGDWDRHDDQWRWGEYSDPDNKDHKIYRAIPRDRDQAFFKNDGFINYIASRPYVSPGLRKFDYEVDFFPGLIFNARHFDRHFLAQLNEETYISIAKELQNDITDEVIQDALSDWPSQIYDISGEEISQKLKKRRSDLVKYAQEFYRYLTKEVTVIGTDGDNTFDITAMPGDKLDVKAYHKHDGKNKLIWKRTIDGKDCNELRLFGLHDDDTFNFYGDEKSSVSIKLVGGSGDDIVNNESQSLSITTYDKKDGMTLEGQKVKAKLKNYRGINKFNRKDWKIDKLIHFPTPTFYTDEGVGLSYNIWWIKNGFRKNPYKSSHQLSLGYFWANNAIVSNYAGHWPEVFGPSWDLRVKGMALGPTFTQWFYGLTNEFIDYEQVFPNEENANSARFHVVRGTHIDINPFFDKKFANNRMISINPSIEYYDLDETNSTDENRFIFQPESNRTLEDFGKKIYAAIGINYTSDRVNNAMLPTKGYKFVFNADYKHSLSNSDFSNLTLESNLASYIPFSPTHKVVFATNIGGAYTFGDAEFFHANYLANRSRLRGYRINRFAGEGILYQASDLRVKLFNGRGGLKTGFGLFTSLDYGRAFVKDENNNDWHVSYGGGIYLAPLDLVGFRIGYFQGRSDVQLSVGGAISF
jgi:hypothetical protein